MTFFILFTVHKVRGGGHIMRIFTRLIAATTLVIGGLAAVPAHAQGLPVFDASNFAEAIQEATSAVTEVSNLEQQLTAQENMIKDLPGTIAPGLVTLAQQTQQLMQQVNTIQSMGASLTGQLNSLYPTDYSSQSFPGILDQVASMQTAQRAAYQTSMAMQSQVAANQPAITQAYKAADAESLAATGPTQAAQANTQALEAVGQQLGDVQGLMIAQQNADAQKAIAEQSADAAGNQVIQNSYTPFTNNGPSIPNPFSDVGQ
jgi:P-type conjugative transfer protein TrbJ